MLDDSRCQALEKRRGQHIVFCTFLSLFFRLKKNFFCDFLHVTMVSLQCNAMNAGVFRLSVVHTQIVITCLLAAYHRGCILWTCSDLELRFNSVIQSLTWKTLTGFLIQNFDFVWAHQRREFNPDDFTQSWTSTAAVPDMLYNIDDQEFSYCLENIFFS